MLALAIVALATAPAAASAEDFFVDSNGDVADQTLDGTCLTAGALCTLRAAIQEANNEDDNPGADTITFSSIVFTGMGNAIDVGATDLPAITSPVSISCQATPVLTPCAQIDSPPVNGLTVSADSVSIHGVAVTNALQGIAVLGSLAEPQITGFELEHSWLGITLDGMDGSNATGLFLDPSVDGAAVGGTTAGARNVFGFNTVVGLRITGADDNTVQGNYFGVLANGSTLAAQPIDIAVNGADLMPTDDPATGNVIGGLLSVAEQGTAECDGPCNVISGATSGSSAGIELHANIAFGNLPAGQTTIQGNYFGFSHDASAGIPNFGTSVGVGQADDVTVGGGGAASANRIVGGGFGITSVSGAEDLQVADNAIGVNFAETASMLPPSIGMSLHSVASGPTSVTNNRVSATGGGSAGIGMAGQGATIADNEVGIGSGGQELTAIGTGITLTFADNATVDSNTIGNATTDGILVRGSESALITGNTIGPTALNGNAGAGVRITNFSATPSTDNTVGGDIAAEENLISNSGEGAVEVEGADSDANLILRNTGAANAGLFIDLGNDGPGATTGANNDIQAPEVTAVAATSAAGTADPGATVRLFEKSSAANGEIAALIGTGVADGSGNWEVTYGSAPAFVGATQAVAADGTSEMAVAEGPDVDPPETTLTKKPKKKSTKRKAKFKFTSSEAGSTFECKLDKKPFKPCESPFKKKRLKPKKHKFLVRATDAAGNTDQTPAKAKFKVLAPE